MIFGSRVERGVTGVDHEELVPRPRSVIGAIETSPAGNLILRVGREVLGDAEPSPWTETEHVVLLPDEARELLVEIAAVLDERAAADEARRYLDEMERGDHGV